MSTQIDRRMTPTDKLVSTLPWIDYYTPRGAFDFVYTKDGSRIEVKDCTKPTVVPIRSWEGDIRIRPDVLFQVD